MNILSLLNIPIYSYITLANKIPKSNLLMDAMSH